MKHINGVTVVFSDDSPYTWRGQDLEWSSFDEYDPCPAIQAHDDAITLDVIAEAKRVLDEANVPDEGRVIWTTQKVYDEFVETFCTNNSLIVCTQDANETNIEDRTMNTKDQIRQAVKELNEVEQAANNEVKKYNGYLFEATLAMPSMPDIDFSLERAEFDECIRARDYIEKAFEEGDIPNDVHVSLTNTRSYKDKVEMSDELRRQIDLFKHDVSMKFASKAQKLRRKIHMLEQKNSAERYLDRLEQQEKKQDDNDSCAGCHFIF